MAKIIIQNPQPTRHGKHNITKRTAAHTCRICGRHIYGNASICPDCLMKQTEEGGRHYGK